MSETEECPECGTALPINSRLGQCPVCLLKRGFQPFESEVDDENLTATVIPAGGMAHSAVPGTGDAAREFARGSTFGDYQIVRRLGSGGMGTVYEADHLASGRRVALKVLSRSLENPEARARFLREGRLAASINHKNSVYVFGTEEIDNIPTISMELISGGTLASHVQKFGPMPVRKAVDSILQVIAGLEAAERKGILHRDVKPANCFVDGFGDVKIGDYGLSISTAPTDVNAVRAMTQEGVFLGTPAFASPEQLRGEQLDQRSDIYAAGVTLFYLLTGRAPFEGKNMVQLLATVLDKAPPRIEELQPHVPGELARVVESCLAKSAGSRPSGYSELRRLLLPFSSESMEPATLGQRFLAGVVDYLVIYVLARIVHGILARLVSPQLWQRYGIVIGVVTAVAGFCYFLLCEVRYGRTPGKRALGLRVVTVGHNPSWKAAGWRAFYYVIIPFLPGLLASCWTRWAVGDVSLEEYMEHVYFLYGMAALRSLSLVLIALLFIPVLRDKDSKAFHDRMTNTEVVTDRPCPVPAELNESQNDFDPVDSTFMIGPYHVLETIAEHTSGHSLILAFDTTLLRRVWIRTHPDGEEPVSNVDRNVSRISRLRWLGGHRGDENWDCYEAPEGHGLVDHLEPDWESDRKLIAALTTELERSVSDGTFPDSLSLDNLWICGSEIKILPFAASVCAYDRPNMTPDGNSNDSEMQERTAARFVWEFANQLQMRQSDPAVRRPLPLSAREQLIELGRSESLTRTRKIVAQLTKGPAIVSRSRRLCMLLVTFAIPLGLAFAGLIGQVVVATAYQQFPRIGEMKQSLSRIQILEAQHRKSSVENPEPEAQLEAFRIHFAGRYRDVFQDVKQWNSSRAMIEFTQDDRRLVGRIMSMHHPTPEEFRQATQIHDEFVGKNPVTVTRSDANFSINGTLMTMLYWMILVWFPGLIATLVFGGGIILQSFGVGFVDSRGRAATRIQLLWRAILPGLPCLIVIVCAVGSSDNNFFSSLFATVPNAVFAIVGSVLLLWTAIRKRFLSDSLSGLYLVPR